VAYSVEDLIELLWRNTDDQGWLQPILEDPDNLAVLRAHLASLARESEAIDRLEANASPATASGGAPGTVALTLTRASVGSSGTIPQGYKFLDLRGVQLVSQAAVGVAAAALSVVVPVETLRQTEAVNAENDPGFRVDPTASTVLDSGGVNPLIAPPGTAGLLSTSFSTVASGGPIVAASADWLSVHGRERGVQRQRGETTGAFRLRVRDIPDAVSPIGVADGVLGAVARVGGLPIPTIQEPFEDQATVTKKDDHALGSFSPIYSDGNTAPESPFHSEFLDDYLREMVGLREARAYFRVVIPQPLNPDGSAAFVPAPPAVATQPPAAMMGALLAVADEARRKKAFGVQDDVYVAEPVAQVGVGSTSVNADTVVFTLLPLAGRAWYLLNAHLGHDASPSGVGLAATMTHRVTFTFTDATTFTTPASGQTDEERLDPYKASMGGFPYGKRISKIEGKLRGDGTNAINLVGTFYVTEVVDP
jgi:hypothetical protein